MCKFAGILRKQKCQLEKNSFNHRPVSFKKTLGCSVMKNLPVFFFFWKWKFRDFSFCRTYTTTHKQHVHRHAGCTDSLVGNSEKYVDKDKAGQGLGVLYSRHDLVVKSYVSGALHAARANSVFSTWVLLIIFTIRCNELELSTE